MIGEDEEKWEEEGEVGGCERRRWYARSGPGDARLEWEATMQSTREW